MPFPARRTVQAYARDGQKAAAALQKQKKEIVLTPKNKQAIELMVFEGRKRGDAAAEVGLTDHALRTALTKPHVLAYLNECQEVLRASLRPRALHTMGELLDEKETGTVRFKAAEYLDGQNRGTHTIGATTVNIQMNQSLTIDKAGYVIDLTADGGHAPQISDLQHVEVNQLETFDDVADDE
jgi:hypothetical protein